MVLKKKQKKKQGLTVKNHVINNNKTNISDVTWVRKNCGR